VQFSDFRPEGPVETSTVAVVFVVQLPGPVGLISCTLGVTSSICTLLVPATSGEPLELNPCAS